ncbi:MAG: cell wall hydrolase [Lachnospiraceae bacterium]|nr:cell wall hydrolase [Lachnospiraceae bacterium]
MMKTNVRYKLCNASALILALSLCLSNTPVFATDTVDNLKNKTSSLESELSGLNSELNAICTKLDDTIAKMQTTSDEIAAAQAELANAQAAEEKQQKDMELRIQYIYETGSMSFLEMLVTSKNMGEFLNTAEFITNINDYDRNMLSELQNMQDEVVKKEASLLQEQATLLTLKEELNTNQAALSAKISSTSSNLADYSAKLAQAQSVKDTAQAQLIAASQNNNSNYTGGTAPSVPSTVGDVALLAAIIECEAGGGSYDGMVAVGGVILNRVNSPKFPNTISAVIYQKGQFSPARTGKLDTVLARGAKSSCINAANDALSGINPAVSCLYFNYAGGGHAGTIIGANVFW